MAFLTLGNQLGLWAFAAVAVLLLIYLFRPKPYEKPIPSLMFFLKDKKTSMQRAFLRTLLRNLLFLLQLLAILALAFAVSQPVFELNMPAKAKQTVLVIDNSASMQTKLGTGTRFTKAIESAQNNLEGKISIVLAESTPLVLMDKGSREEASKALASIKPKESSTNIGDAMLLGAQLLGDTKGRIVVISDFISTTGTDPVVAKQTIAAKKIPLKFINLGGDAQNIGITDVKLDKEQTRVYIKNFNDRTADITVKYENNKKTIETISRTLLANSVEVFNFKTAQGISDIMIDGADDLSSDNVVFTNVPDIRKANILLISSTPYVIDPLNSKRFIPQKDPSVTTCSDLNTRMNELTKQKKLKETSSLVQILAALSDLNKINCDYRFPPILPNYNELQKYDIVIFHNFENEFTPVNERDIERAADNGTSLIVTAQDNGVQNQALLNLMPVSIFEQINMNSSLSKSVELPYLKDVEFSDTERHFRAEAKENAITVALDSKDSSVMIAQQSHGMGTVVYYGILDQYSNFKKTPSYPVFWNRLIGYLTETSNLDDYNFAVDRIITVKNPQTGEYEKVLLDEVGIKDVENKQIAVNLINEKESDVSKKVDLGKDIELESYEGEGKEKVEAEYYLILAGLLFLCLEFLYLKWRGDI